MKAALPFSIDLARPVCFADQVVEGFKSAICAGRYKAGDRLPTWRQLAEALDVSQRVPREAMARLAREGWIISRPRLGSVVTRGPMLRKSWKGTVLILQTKNASESYSNVCMSNVLERMLARAGYAVIRTTVDHRGGKHMPYDLAMADRLLSFKVDFVVIDSSHLQFRRWLDARGLPHVCGNDVRFDFTTAVDDFAAHCRKSGVRRVLQVGFTVPGLFDAVPALRAQGISAERWCVPCERDPMPNQVTEAGVKAFAARLRRGLDWLPDVLLVTDDYLAVGVLMALAHAGVRLPERLKFVTFACAGNEPVFPVKPAMIVADCTEQGERLVRMVLGALVGKPVKAQDVMPRYVPGGTFPAC